MTVRLGLVFLSILFTGEAYAVDRVLITAGQFLMGCSTGDPDCEKDEALAGGLPVVVPAFLIDRYEVTVKQYRECVAAGACTLPLTNERNQYCNYDNPARDEHPVNCVDWQQAVNYCTWSGGRLPREAEWERAARAGSVTRYPWGEDATCEHAVLDEVSPEPSPQEPDGCGVDSTWPIGSRPANAYGLYDMHGNAGEWTATWYAPQAITQLYAAGDLDGPPSGRQRVVRGGSWDENRPNLRSSFRNVKPPEQGDSIYGSVGFRCAADLAQ